MQKLSHTNTKLKSREEFLQNFFPWKLFCFKKFKYISALKVWTSDIMQNYSRGTEKKRMKSYLIHRATC